MRIGTKLGIAMMVAGIAGMAVADYVAYRSSRDALQDAAFDRISAVRRAYSLEVLKVFGEIEKQLRDVARDPLVARALTQFANTFETALPPGGLTEEQVQAVVRYYEEVFIPALGDGEMVEDWFPVSPNAVALQYLYLAANPWPIGAKDSFLTADDLSAYSGAHRLHHPMFQSLRNYLNLYDVLLTDTAGTVVYTTIKETDFGTNLFSGPYRNSALGRILRANQGNVRWSVMDAYVPSYADSVIHVFAPALDERGESLGSLIFQVDVDRVLELNGVTFGATGRVVISSIADGVPFGLMIPGDGPPPREDIGLGRDANGVSVLGSFGMLELDSDSIWVTATFSGDEAFASLTVTRKRVFFTSFLLAPIFLTAGLFFARRLTRSLSELADMADAVAFTGPGSPIVRRTGDEVLRVTGAVRRMTDRLAKYTVSWKYLDNVFASMAEGVFVATESRPSQELLVERVNVAMTNLLHAKESQVVGSKVVQWFRADAKMNTGEWDWRPDGDNITKEETVLVTADGREISVAVSVALVSDQGPNKSSYVFVVRDIGARKLAVAALRRAAAVVKASSNPIIVLAGDGCVTEVNPAFEATTKLTGKAVLGSRPDFLDLDVSDIEDMLRQAALGVPWRGEVGLVVAGNVKTHMMVSTSATFNESGNVESYILVMSDITGLKQSEARFAAMARQDPLTGAANRTEFIETLHETVEQARAKDRFLAVLYIDLDGFKAVNDSFGHAAGDAILVEVIARLKEVIRSSDLLARLGGDEFAILLPNLRVESGVTSVASNIVDSLRKPFLVSGTPVTVHCSVGCAVFPTDAARPDSLLKEADLAMYDAKRAGKNTFRRKGGGPKLS